MLILSLGFPKLEQYGSIDEELGFIAMELLGANSLEILRKIEQRKSKEKCYGLPMASVVAIAVKLVLIRHSSLLDRESEADASHWLLAF